MTSSSDTVVIAPASKSREWLPLASVVMGTVSLWFTLELSDPAWTANVSRAAFLECLPVWLRVPPFAFTTAFLFLMLPMTIMVDWSGRALELSAHGLTTCTLFGWKTYGWDAFSDSEWHHSERNKTIILTFADRTIRARVRRRAFSSAVRLIPANYEERIEEIADAIGRFCPRLSI